MENTEHHWLTIHRVKFPERIAATERVFEAPGCADAWRFCPSMEVTGDGLPSWTSDVWGGLGIHTNRADAESLLRDLGAHVPWMSEAVESQHALLLPIAHHGVTNWRGAAEDGTAIRTSQQKHDGKMVVLTSAGFETRDLPRIKRFMKGVNEVIDYYGTLPGNLFRDVFNGGYDGIDGFTLSIWDADKSMISAAYQAGIHKSWMDESKDGSLFDRSSFTRARLVESLGDWNGATAS